MPHVARAGINHAYADIVPAIKKLGGLKIGGEGPKKKKKKKRKKEKKKKEKNKKKKKSRDRVGPSGGRDKEETKVGVRNNYRRENKRKTWTGTHVQWWYW